MRNSSMRLATPFDPIEIGEIDNFAFDFTADMGAATMVSTSWTCALAPFQTATDPVPQSRVLSVSTQTAIQSRAPSDGSLQTRTGFFSVASIGGMPIEATEKNPVRVCSDPSLGARDWIAVWVETDNTRDCGTGSVAV